MYHSSLAFLALALATLTSAASSACPFNYPSTLNTTTSHNGLVFTIISNNPVTNNRAVQLRPNIFFEGGYFTAIDDSSPVLLGNLKNGGLYSQARNIFNQLNDLGPTGYLNLRTEVDGTSQWSVGFANATLWPGSVEEQWKLDAPTSDGTYSLFHEEPLEVANGFLLCEADIDLSNGPWFQLFYQTYKTSPTEFKGCESVGVRTSVGASIFNGECDIGGVIADA